MKFGHRMQLLTFHRAFPGAFAVLLFLALSTSSARAQNTISTVAGGGTVNGSGTGSEVRIGAPARRSETTTADVAIETGTTNRRGITIPKVGWLKPHPIPHFATNSYADIPGPSSVVTDPQGNTYVASPNAQEVFVISNANEVSVFAGIGYSTENPENLDHGPATSASLNEPTGLAIDAAGNIYIADTTNYLIRKVDTAGIITSVAGNTDLCRNSTQPCGDGKLAVAAQLSYPAAVAVDAAGNLYIADSVDNRIRVVNTQSIPIKIAGVRIGPNDIRTIAGNGTPCASSVSLCGDGGAATAANLTNPLGVVVDSAGNIYISDSGDRRVRIVTPQGSISTYAGTGLPCHNPALGCGDGGAATSANLSTPWQISVDNSGNLYISDPPENRIRLVNSATKIISSVAGNGAMGFNGNGGPAIDSELNSPRGVWVDTFGNVTIGDSGNQQVRVVTPDGFINLVAGKGSGGDSGPATSAILAADHDVALDSAGNLYIADTANNRIRMVTPGNPPGNIYTVAGTGYAGNIGNSGPATSASLNTPYGLTVDGSGNIYIADTLSLEIRLVTASTGIINLIAGNGQKCVPTNVCGDGGSALHATFSLPTKVALDNAGNIYIADSGANRIRMINSAGIISTIAGTGVRCANPLAGSCGDNGPATSALLNGPMSVAVDASGNVYIADTGDNRIRKIDSTGTITAYAFTGNNAFGPDKVDALSSSYNTPQYITLDPHGNMYVSGSDFFYVIQRIDAFDHTVSSVAGKTGDPKYYGFAGDGGPAIGAELNNFGVAVDGSGNLFIADGGNNRVRYIGLSPIAITSATNLNFPAEPIGTTSPAMSFNLTNQGGDDLYLSGPPVVTGDFVLTGITGTTCAQNVISPSGECTYQLTFTPSGYGVRHGSIVITDNSYGHTTQTVNLSGRGPDFTISASPNTLSVAPGSQATSTLTLTPIAGFNQTVNLTCMGAPAGTTCTESPNTVTLDGSDAATSTLTVSVGSGTKPGTYTLRAIGTSVTTHQATITLTVQ